MTSAAVFTNNRSQAIRLPASMRLPETLKRVDVRARGLERIISPVGHAWDSFFLGEEAVPEDFMNERASQYQPEREAF